MAEYLYQPIYGIEPWENNANAPLVSDFGGGARRTNENFLVSLWTIDVYGDNAFQPVAGRLLRPANVTPFAAMLDGFIPGLGTNGLKTVFDSRTSARFQYTTDAFVPSTINFPLLAILNPPQDMKTQYQNTVKASLDPSAPGGLNIRVLRSIADLGAMEAYFYNNDFSGPLAGSTSLGSILGNILGTTALTATDGSDGVFPTFFDYTTPASVVAAIDAISRGAFFLPVLIAPTEADNFTVTLNWPHTAARG